ncbi:hypothetical protein K440DRAFT_555517 [Wilcoxina mikolae CBS 423.85]|nr:hypothetical protein K440DRAFT_555517 [Wilcoxina mikolae CBS 423.85]
MNDEIAGGGPGPCGKARTPLPQFFNGTITAFDTTQTPKVVSWNGFPNRIALKAKNQAPLRWQMADASRLVQDEYLEWTVARDNDGNIISCTFTCEGPEYWQFIADFQNTGTGGAVTVTDLYQKLNPDYASQISESDLFLVNQNTGATVYNPMNFWNQSSENGTIAHLIHPANTLGAEIDISAQATVIRADQQGKIITDSNQLINCSKYGNASRNSDPVVSSYLTITYPQPHSLTYPHPQIGSTINSLSRAGNSISIADPVALYIQSFNTSTLLLQTGPDTRIPLPPGTVTYPRGAPPMCLRIQIKIPDGVKGADGTQLTLSDIYDTSTNETIQYGAQFADYITIGVAAVAIGNVTVASAQPCPCAPAPAPPGGPPVEVAAAEVGEKKHTPNRYFRLS